MASSNGISKANGISKQFEGKAAIITGSSRGIGRGIALEFGKSGASVTIHGQSKEKLEETKKLLMKNGVKEAKILAVIGPIQEKKTIKAIVDETVAKFGRIDVLVNNAGLMNLPGENLDSLKTFDYVFGVNVRSVIELTDLCASHLEKTKGNVVNISSAVAIRNHTSMKFYSMSKVALDHYSRSMANELGAKGIRVNIVNPGPIESDFGARTGMHEMEPKQLDGLVKSATILNRWGTPEEVGNLVTFLASQKASFMTGGNFVIDGGYLAKG